MVVILVWIIVKNMYLWLCSWNALEKTLLATGSKRAVLEMLLWKNELEFGG